MKNLLLQIYNLFLRVDPSKPVPVNPLDKPGWTLTFNDEFDNLELNESKWFTQYQDRPNPFTTTTKPIQEYYDKSAIGFSPDCAILRILKDKRTFPVKDWNGDTGEMVTIPNKTGMLIAKQDGKLFSQQYGYFEIRARIGSKKGMWPSFWLSGSKNWPPEIDIFEFHTGKSFTILESNYHRTKDGQHVHNARKHKIPDISKAFHVYACEWDNEFIRWYFDNQLIRIESRDIELMNEPLILIVSNGIDPNFTPDIPAWYAIDYVRVYEKKPETIKVRIS